MRNVLFIMCDQLRWDYLSCAGHPHLHTPNIDALAARGVRFNRAYAQSPICGSSRMSFYTGRYVGSHGASWNNIPLKVGELTLGDHLRPLGVRVALAGKTHMRADVEGMRRLGVSPDSEIGVLVSQCGFEPWERHDGLHPSTDYGGGRPAYDEYLRGKGWNADNPWEEVANSAVGDDGETLSGWFLRHANKPARVAEEDSETPYVTRRAMEFVEQAGDQPWLLHLSYIKPHWPCIAPAPYHAMYGPETHQPVVRAEAERAEPHPIYREFMVERVSQAFSRDEVRTTVLTGYMGLIKQIDDQVGVFMRFLEERGLLDETMIVFTSDHGDYLGDHWLGEKGLMHDASVRIPLIVVDPRSAADVNRGTVSDALVESIDLVPTFLDYYGGAPKPHIIEGRSLEPLLHGAEPSNWRRWAIAQYDYSFHDARPNLKMPPLDAQLYMVFDGRWKLTYCEGFRPMLYDLANDPGELVDRGGDAACRAELDRLTKALFRWARRNSQRTTMSDAQIEAHTGKAAERGILIGYWDESELTQE